VMAPELRPNELSTDFVLSAGPGDVDHRRNGSLR
jgi:hypothetical protein